MKSASFLFAVLWGAVCLGAEHPYGHPDFLPSPERPIGFCGDGNSWFPGASSTPVEWWDGTPGWAKVCHRGGMGNTSPPLDDSTTEVEMRVLLDRMPKNILWKVPVPGWGDSQPIVVGQRIINCYWPHLIVCCDAATGKELWRNELELCLLPSLEFESPARRCVGPAPDPAEGRKLQTLFELGHAMRHLSHNLRDFEGDDPGKAEIPLVQKALGVMGAWRKALETVCPEAIPELDYDIGLAKRFVAGEFGILGLGEAKLDDDREALKEMPQFGQHASLGFVRFVEKKCQMTIDNAWPGWCAYQMATPTSDGEIVVARFGNGQVGAFEVATGKRLWAWRDPKVKGNWTWHCPSPRIGREVVMLDAIWKYDLKYDDPRSVPSGLKESTLEEGLLPQRKRWGKIGGLLGIDKRTGQIRWWLWEKPNSGYPSSTPLLMDLPLANGGVLPVVVSINGGIYRQADGRPLGQLEVDQTAESYTLHRGDLVVANAEGGAAMFRLRAVSADKVAVETVREEMPLKLHRSPAVMTDDFAASRGGNFNCDTPLRRSAASRHAGGSGGSGAPSVVGRHYIYTSYNYFDDKFRPRRDGMCLVTFHVSELPRLVGDAPVPLSDHGLLGGAEAPADLFFDKHLPGFDKMRQINPRKWCGRYGAHLPAWFGHRANGVVGHGDRIYIQGQCHLYCIGPAVKGTPADDPAVVAGIRAETDLKKLAGYLGHASAQYRCEAVRRLAAIKTPLAANVMETLERMLAEDVYEEIRAAAMLALDACDPRGQAGWSRLCRELAAAYPVDGRSYGERDAADKRRRVLLLFRALDKDGPAVMAKRWPQAAGPVERRGLLEIATVLGWRVEGMLKSALEWCQVPPGRGDGHIPRLLPAYFAAVDAAAHPSVAQVLLKVYPADWTLLPTFDRHLTKQQKLAWLETAGPANMTTQKAAVLGVWQEIGAEAIPSMRRVAAKLAADTDNAAAIAHSKAVTAAIEGLQKP